MLPINAIKKFTVLIVMCCSIFSLYSQTNVKLHKRYFDSDFYLYEIEASILGVQTKIIIDSGASFSSLRGEFVEELLESGKVSMNNINPTLQRIFGITGKEVGLLTIKIKDLSVNGLKIENLNFVISKDDKTPNILGLPFLSRFASVKFDFENQSLLLNDLIKD